MVRIRGGVGSFAGGVRNGVGERVLDLVFIEGDGTQSTIRHPNDGVACGRRPVHRLGRILRIAQTLFVNRHSTRERGLGGLGNLHRYRGLRHVLVSVRHLKSEFLRIRYVGLGRERVVSGSRIEDQRPVLQFEAELPVIRGLAVLPVHGQ